RHRYTMHDLVRSYAVEVAGERLSADEAQRARARLLDYYRHASAAATGTLYPVPWTPVNVPPAATPVPRLDDVRSARGWLDVERPNLVAACAAAADNGLSGHATDLSQVLWQYLDNRFYDDAEKIHEQAVRAGGPGRAASLTLLGLA